MSFGFSAGDIVTLVKLATKTYEGWKNACSEYADITNTLDSLCILLGRIRDEANKPASVLARNGADREELRDVLRGCRKTVEELNAVVVKFKSLSSSRKKNWDRVRLGVKNLSELRAKLTQHTTTITAYLEAVGLGSLARIEDRLSAIPTEIQQNIDALVAEIRAGRREGSVMTTYEDDEKDVWRQFRREMVMDGINSSVIHRHKPLIRQYLRRLAEEGMLEEEEPPAGDDGPSKHLDPQHSRTAHGIGTSDLDDGGTDAGGDEEVMRGTTSGKTELFASAEYADTEEVLVYQDVHHVLNHEAPSVTKYHRNVFQPGPRGYFMSWTLPLHPSVSEHHIYLSHLGPCRYAHRLYFVHHQRRDEVKRFISHRKEQGRQVFLNRHIPWLPLRGDGDRTDLHITLPPHWTYEFSSENRLSFLDHASAVFSYVPGRPDAEEYLPQVFDPHAAIPLGWRVESIGGKMLWWQSRTTGFFFVHPAERSHLEQGRDGLYDHMWLSKDPENKSTTAPRALFDLRDIFIDPQRVGQLREHDVRFESTMALWKIFPELSVWHPGQRAVQRETMHLEWTAELEEANPGMREHLIEWQERMDNIARCHPETKHLVSCRSKTFQGCLNESTKDIDAGEDQASFFADDNFHNEFLESLQRLDYYSVSLPVGFKESFEFAFDDYTYALRPIAGTRESLNQLRMEMPQRSRFMFHILAGEVLWGLEAVVNGLSFAASTNTGKEIGLQGWRGVEELAFACFFATASAPYQASLDKRAHLLKHELRLRSPEENGLLGASQSFVNDNQHVVWGTVAKYIRILYGDVKHQPGEFVIWLGLNSLAWSERGESQSRLYEFTRWEKTNGAHKVTTWMGDVTTYRAEA